MQSLWMIVASFLFACMGVCVKLAAQTHSVVEITFWRSFIALLMLFALVRVRGVTLATPHWRWHVTRGVVGYTALFGYFYAIPLLPLATAVTLNYTSAIFLALYLALSGLRLRLGMLGALALGLLGVGLLLRPSFHADQLWGALVGLASGVIAAMAYFSVRELGRRGESEIRTVFYFSLVATLCSLVWLAFGDLHALDLHSGLMLLGVGVFAALAQLAMTRAYSRGKTLMSAALAYSTVIFSSFAGMLFWDEMLPMIAWLGIALIILSGIGATHFSRTPAVRG